MTAAAAALACDTDRRLDDCDYGRWAGLTLAEVERREPDALAAWFADPAARPHGGEALADVAARVSDWLADCADRPGRSSRHLAVTHPLVIRLAAVLALGAPLVVLWRIDVAPLSVTRLTGQGGRWRLAGLNDAG